MSILFSLLVSCTIPASPSNGHVTCSGLIFDVIFAFKGTTCSFMCNTGYELNGSDVRACRSDGTWNGTSSICNKGNQFTEKLKMNNNYCTIDFLYLKD